MALNLRGKSTLNDETMSPDVPLAQLGNSDPDTGANHLEDDEPTIEEAVQYLESKHVVSPRMENGRVMIEEFRKEVEARTADEIKRQEEESRAIFTENMRKENMSEILIDVMNGKELSPETIEKMMEQAIEEGFATKEDFIDSDAKPRPAHGKSGTTSEAEAEDTDGLDAFVEDALNEEHGPHVATEADSVAGSTQDGASQAGGDGNPDSGNEVGEGNKEGQPEVSDMASHDAGAFLKDLDAPDPLGDYVPSGNPVYDALMSALWYARADKREEVNFEMKKLHEQRMLLIETLRNEMNQQNQSMIAGQQGGAPGGLFSGIGSIGTSIARMLGKDSTKRTADALKNVNAEIQDKMAFRKIALDRQYVRMMASASTAMIAQHNLPSSIHALNAAVSNHPDGNRFLTDLNEVAKSRDVEINKVWDAIHDGSVSDEDIVGLRRQADNLSSDPVIAEHLNQAEVAYKEYSVHSEKFKAGLEQVVKRNGMEIPGLNAELVENMRGMDCPDAAVARPGGERLDSMKSKFAEMRDKLIEAIMNFVESIKNIIGLGKKSA